MAIYVAGRWSPGVIIWDPRHMIDEDYVRPVWPDVQEVTFVQNGDELQDAIDHNEWRKGPIVFRPNATRLREDFQEMCGVLFDPPEKYSGSGFSLVIDEAAQLQGPNSIDPHLDRAVRQHPRSVLVVQTTHSLQDWHRASKDLMSQLYCFRQVGRSLKAVVEFCDEDEDFEETIRTLPQHWCVRYDFEAVQGQDTWFLLYEPRQWYKPVRHHKEV